MDKKQENHIQIIRGDTHNEWSGFSRGQGTSSLTLLKETSLGKRLSKTQNWLQFWLKLGGTEATDTTHTRHKGKGHVNLLSENDDNLKVDVYEAHIPDKTKQYPIRCLAAVP